MINKGVLCVLVSLTVASAAFNSCSKAVPDINGDNSENAGTSDSQSPQPGAQTLEFILFDASGAHASETVLSVSFVPSGADIPLSVVPDIVSEIGVDKTSYKIKAESQTEYSGRVIVESSAARFTFNSVYILSDTLYELDLSEADLVEITTVMGWKSFANAVDKGDYSAWKNPDGEVKLGADLKTVTYLQRVGATENAHCWDGIFNGQGHTITQTETTVPLFTVIAEDGIVENLVLKGNLNKASYPQGPSTAAVAQTNRGIIRNVTNAIDIVLTDINSAYMIGGMVIMNGGLIEDCVQEGDISVSYNVTSAQIVTYIGGLACFAADAAEYRSSMSDVNVGTFRRCTNRGNITVNKTGVARAYLNKFAIGGICAIVQNGTAEKSPLFEDCCNEGGILRKDDSNGFNSCSAIGGIVGRAANYYQLKAGGAFDVENYNVYLQILNCHNTGDIECSAFLTQGWDKGQATSCARMGTTGGIIGYVNGFADTPALISGCSSRCTLRGGHINQSVILGGIAGMTSYTTIKNCTAETVFKDSSLDLDALLLASVGGVIGHVRHDSTVSEGEFSAEISMPKTEIPYCGMAAGGCYTFGESSQTLTVAGSKLRGSVSHKGLDAPVTVTAENLGDNLVSFGTCNADGVSYWKD